MNVLLVGLGKATWLYAETDSSLWAITHTHSLNRIEDFRITAGCDIDLSLAKSWAVTFQVPIFATLKDVEGDFDLVVIAVNHENLFECLLVSLEKWPNAKVLVEKPLVTNLEDFDKLLTLNTSEIERIWINFPRLFQPETRLLKDILENCSHDLRNTKYLVSGFYTGGYLNTASHLISLMNFLFGDLKYSRLQEQSASEISFIFENEVVFGKIRGSEQGPSTFGFDILGSGVTFSYRDGGAVIRIFDVLKGENEIESTRLKYQFEVYKSLLRQWSSTEEKISTLQSQMQVLNHIVKLPLELVD